MDDVLKEFFGDSEEKINETTEFNQNEAAAEPVDAASEIITGENAAEEYEAAPIPEAPAEPEAAKAAFEEPEAAAQYEDVYSGAAEEPEVPSVESAEPETVIAPPEIKPAEPQYIPPTQSAPPVYQNGAPQAQAVNPPYEEPLAAFNGNYNQNQNRATYYQPPVSENAYGAPPVFNQAGQYAQNQTNAANVTPKKKRSKAPWIIGLIILLCIAVAGFGIKSAISSYTADRNSKTESGESSNPLEEFLNGDDDNTNGSEDAQASVNSSDEAAKKDSKGNLTVAGVAAENKDSCVGITVYTDQQSYDYFNFYGMPNQQSGEKVASGEGSGVIMSESDGKTYIMTCAHVIADGSSFTVTLDNDETYDAQMVGYDSQTDIGVLVIEAKGLKVAEFGDSKDIEVGEDCVAIGCPGGLQFKNSVTKGIVSALDVPVSSSIGYDNECIQVDAAINPGNSGGALFNMQGQVIGINSSKIASTEYEGMGFAVPSNTAVETANSLIVNGYVKGRAKLGITYNTLSAYASANSILSALAEKGYENAEGTMVIQEISSDSDLSGKAQQYDMIVAVNGETMTSVDVLTSILSKSSPGDTVKLTIARINNNSIDTFDIECKLVEAKE